MKYSRFVMPNVGEALLHAKLKQSESRSQALTESDDDYIDIQPWPVAELIGQLAAHVAIGRRGLIESDTATDDFERETDRFELDAWAKLELSSWLTPEDDLVLDAPIDSLSAGQIDHCEDALVMASSIAWSARVVNESRLPIITDGAPELQTLAWSPRPWTPIRNVLKGIRVRSDETLAAERERWEILYWRCQLFTDNSTDAEDRQALRDMIRELGGQALLGHNAEDLELEDGRSFTDLDDGTIDELAHQAGLRLRALNWVCGFGASPDSAPLYVDE